MGRNRGKLSGGKVYRRGDSTQTWKEATEVKQQGVLIILVFIAVQKDPFGKE